MKVRDTLNNPSGMLGVVGKDERKVSDSRETSFQNQLKRVEAQNFEQRINEMIGKIMEQGEKLSKKADIRELKIYKKLISEFIEEAVSNSHKFSKKSSLDRRGRHKIYALIRKVNEELDSLTNEILSNERDNIRILQKLDDIRGLILDLEL